MNSKTDAILSAFSRDVIWGIVEIVLFGMYVLTAVALFYLIYRIILRSLARAIIINTINDDPDMVMNLFLKMGLRRRIVQLTKYHDITSNNVDSDAQVPEQSNDSGRGVEHSQFVEEIYLAIVRKIRRNIYKFNRFEGPVYPTYRLNNQQIVHYHFILEKLREPGFSRSAAKRLVYREIVAANRGRWGTSRTHGKVAALLIRRAVVVEGVNNAYFLLRKMLLI